MLDFGQFDFGQFDFGQLAEVGIGRSRNWPKSKLAEVEIGRSRYWPKSELAEVELAELEKTRWPKSKLAEVDHPPLHHPPPLIFVSAGPPQTDILLGGRGPPSPNGVVLDIGEGQLS